MKTQLILFLIMIAYCLFISGCTENDYLKVRIEKEVKVLDYPIEECPKTCIVTYVWKNDKIVWSNYRSILASDSIIKIDSAQTILIYNRIKQLEQ